MEPRNRLSEIFREMGIVGRPTDELLGTWGMTLHRFNQLVHNKSRTPMTVAEMTDLKSWLHKNFKGRNSYLFESEMPAEFRNKQLKMEV